MLVVDFCRSFIDIFYNILCPHPYSQCDDDQPPSDKCITVNDNLHYYYRLKTAEFKLITPTFCNGSHIYPSINNKLLTCNPFNPEKNIVLFENGSINLSDKGHFVKIVDTCQGTSLTFFIDLRIVIKVKSPDQCQEYLFLLKYQPKSHTNPTEAISSFVGENPSFEISSNAYNDHGIVIFVVDPNNKNAFQIYWCSPGSEKFTHMDKAVFTTVKNTLIVTEADKGFFYKCTSNSYHDKENASSSEIFLNGQKAIQIPLSKIKKNASWNTLADLPHKV